MKILTSVSTPPYLPTYLPTLLNKQNKQTNKEEVKLAKARVLKGVAFSGPDITLPEEMDKIARRDNTSFNALMVSFARDYVKAHGSGNPVYPLDAFAGKPEMLALPTIYEDPNPEKVHNLSNEDKTRIKKQMAKWWEALQK